MKIELGKSILLAVVAKQLDNIFVYFDNNERWILEDCIDIALKKCEYCFSKTTNKYYHKDGFVYFNPFHSGQYSIFLYFLSNAIFNHASNCRTLADRVYYLNKCLNGLDLFYEVKMPKIFFLDHPVGSVIGRGTFEDYFGFSQNCTVGNNKGKYPKIGKNVKMMSGSKIIGNCEIGDNVIISANTYIKDINIPSCSLVFGIYPDLCIVPKPSSYFISS